ncbi:PadR family transcriptional regulator [Pseudomonas sp. RP23018S]|uniref:PadR family transcriptional regulator n=1 Tax=Pseudomonas sp. RP23018S TaxID=3096037 RepID=UPI002ACA4E3F|nr:PadR family transcriptional regulator [Pseudomonas sp. RP23018S]MDZ5603552.1 PadR family transcriptional regulator [Pseudomonas sp. RP23018S]
MRNPLAQDPFERRGGRGPRVFAPGDLKLLLLSMLAEHPGHGYDLIRQIESLFDAQYSPSPGVIYPTLNFLEEAELIQGQSQGSKRLYAITALGRHSLLEQAAALDGVRMRIEVSKRALVGHERPEPIHQAVGNLRHALHLHSGQWSAEEIERVSRLLNDTAKAIAAGPTPLAEGKAP